MIPESLVPTLAVVALIVGVLGLLLGLWAVLRLRRIGRRGLASVSQAYDPSAEAERIDGLARQLAVAAKRLEAAEAQGARSIQRIGVVRYNPFADTGSNQSFVLAMLDAHGDGFVLSTLHSRQQTRMFLKAVSGGKGDMAISAEEAEAIRLASSR